MVSTIRHHQFINGDKHLQRFVAAKGRSENSTERPCDLACFLSRFGTQLHNRSPLGTPGRDQIAEVFTPEQRRPG